MKTCIECEYSELCIVFRAITDYMAPDGKLREIVGCGSNKFFYGEVLTPETPEQECTP